MVLKKRALWSGSFLVVLGGAVATVYLLTGASSPRRNIDDSRHKTRLVSDEVSVERYPLERITPGTQVTPGGIEGWSHLVLLARPRLASGDVPSLHSLARTWASMFMLTIAADVETAPEGGYYLAGLGVGFSCLSGHQIMVVSSEDTAGANLGFIDCQVLAGNETCLNDVCQVARTRQMIVFDAARTTMVINGQYQQRVTRHAVLADAQTGDISTFVWLLQESPLGYELPQAEMRWLKSNLREDRIVHVDKAYVNALGIPSADAFALVQLPPGETVAVAKDWEAAAAARTMKPHQVASLEARLSEIAGVDTRHP